MFIYRSYSYMARSCSFIMGFEDKNDGSEASNRPVRGLTAPYWLVPSLSYIGTPLSLLDPNGTITKLCATSRELSLLRLVLALLGLSFREGEGVDCFLILAVAELALGEGSLLLPPDCLSRLARRKAAVKDKAATAATTGITTSSDASAEASVVDELSGAGHKHEGNKG
jgi:hypothetical protein